MTTPAVEVQIDAKKLIEDLRLLPVKLRASAYRKALRAAGLVTKASIEDAIRARTERLTGTLRQARALRIATRVSRRAHDVKVNWSSDAWYGKFIARGTESASGEQLIAPRVFTDTTTVSGLSQSEEKRILDAYIAAFTKALDKAWAD